MTTSEPRSPFEIVASTLAGWPDPAVAIAASRAGATGLLDLEHTTDPAAARPALARLARFGRGSLGVKLPAEGPLADRLARELPSSINLVVLTGSDAASLSPAIARVRAPGRRVLVECTSLEGAQDAVAAGADGLVAKGHEAGGHVGEETTFILVQRLRSQIDRAVLAYGGIGLHTAAACYVAGCSGIVVDAQLALARESALPSRLRAALERMEGDETLCVGGELGHLFRVYRRPGMAAVEALQQLEASLATQPAEQARERWRQAIRARIGGERPESQVWPLGQDGAFAARLARRFHTVAGIVDGLRAAAVDHVELARAQRAFDRAAPLAQSQGTEYPILQGPMTRVSDTAAFAEAVAQAGGLPFLALALLRGPQVRTLLEETRARLHDRPWGVGILGFVPVELRQEQLDVIHDFRPGFAIIAGGRPDQAAQLESSGIATYLHVPAPGLLRVFLEGGARRFIFEGRECGGHVGPRTSFVLWQTMIDVLLDAIDGGVPADPLHVVFAGGIHDDLSAAMVAAMAAPLVERGVRVGVLLGTAYLFTEEAVGSNAIVEGFQREALSCTHTVLLETGPGHSTRCADTPFQETFRQARRRLVAEGRPAEEIRSELEALNLGRLRIASKGIARDPGVERGRPRYVEVDCERQHQEGMFMIGQLAALRQGVCRVADLHESVSAGSARRLAGMALPRGPVRDVVVAAERPSDVAIIGMGCLLPKAPDVPSFWTNVLNKVDAITEVPKERFDIDLYYDPDRKARDKVYSRWGGFLDAVPFDPMRYGIPPNALPSIDSLQLLSLEVVRQALADAGYLDREFPRERTSVILGLSGGLGDLGLGYGIRANLPMFLSPAPAEVLQRLPEWTEDSFAGILLNVAAGRVANRFDLGGVNYTVDAACASSLAAVYLAVSELESGRSDMVIVGGVDTVQSPFGFLCFSKAQALSPRGRCRTFDAGADGIAISEGLAMLVLKRRAEAERDGDRIYAVLRGVAGSSDGRGRSLTAPRPEGQTLALERAYARAGISPATVGLIEAHGTGTVVGDAAEVAALSEVFEAAGAAPASCAIGSVKSMVGHTKSAAGVTGMMKVALALYHKVLPPTLHVETPNPRLRESGNPFFVNGEPLPWLPAKAGAPRRAGVSSFGFGGTNFHAVLEEHLDDYTDPTARRTSETWPAELFVWNGASAAGLEASLATLQASLERGARPALRSLAATVCAAAAAERGEGGGEGFRLGIVAADLDDLRGKLSAAREALQTGRSRLQDPKGLYLAGSRPPGKLAFLFPGQGSQAPHMLRDLALHFPQLRQACEEADRALEGRLPQRLSAYIFPPAAFTPAEQDDRMRAITDTMVAQPALGAVELGLLHLLADLGIQPDMVAGHSYGEYVALAAAGVLSERALLEISAARGRIIKESVGEAPGTMAAVLAPAEKVAEALRGLPDVWLANFNAPEQTIIAGAPGDVDAAVQVLGAAGLRSRPIPVACAFHSPRMESARGRLAEALARLELSSPRIPVFSNAEAAPYPEEPSRVAAVLSEHLVKPVRFLDEIRAMHDLGARLFLEVGPKSVLTGLVRQILEGRDAVVLATDLPDRNGLVQLLHALAQLAVAGVQVRLDRLFEGRSVVPLELDGLDQARLPGPPGMAWVVNGAGARPAGPAGSHPPPVPLEVRTALTPPAAPSGVPPALAAPSAPLPPLPESGRSAAGVTPTTPPDAVMLQFQNLMSQFLQTQAAVMNAYLQGGGAGLDAIVPPSRPAAAPAPVVPAPVHTTEPAPAVVAAAPLPAAPRDVAPDLLRIVSERTGYPPDMLKLDVSIEADLGIDSIKRVEILSAFQRECSAEEQSRVHTVMERLTALKTLREMSQVLAETVSDGAASPSPAPAGPAARLPVRDIEADLLRVVSERTGYPVELLQQDSRIEADLGIDSIKRVEILSEFQRGCSAEGQRRLQAVMERLTALKTLRELIAMLGESLAEDSGPPAPAEDGKPGGVAAPRAEAEPTDAVEDVPRLVLQAVSAPFVRGSGRGFAGRVWLITDDEGGLAETVASRLLQADERPVLLRHQAAACELGPGRYGVDLTKPDEIAAAVDRIRRTHGAASAILHLLPLKAGADFDDLSADAWRGRVQTDIKALYGLIHAAAADLTAAGRPGGAMILAATGVGASLAGGASGGAPTHGGVAALLKTVAAEMPEVGCRTVHLDVSEPPDERAAHVLAEMGAVDGPTEVGYIGQRRLTLMPRLVPLPPGRNETRVTSDWVFLLTGGARGITAEIAAYLALSFKPTLVIVGLSSAPMAEAMETAAIADPQSLKAALTASMRAANPAVKPSEVEAAWQRRLRDREIRRNLTSLRETGAQVEYHPVDVRDDAAFGALIDETYRTHGRLDAVVHGAGIIEDKLLKDKTADSFDRVVHTKTDSAFTLIRRLRPEGLKLLIFMSSVTATFGNRGQADYGAANGVLNALATLLSARWPARVRALNWGPWDKTGMVSEHVKRQFDNRGIQVIPVASGVAAVALEIEAEPTPDAVVVLGGGPWVVDAARPRDLEITA